MAYRILEVCVKGITKVLKTSKWEMSSLVNHTTLSIKGSDHSFGALARPRLA